MNITIVKRPQEDPAMTHSRIVSLFAGLMSVLLAGVPAAFAQTATKATWVRLTL